MSPILFDRGSHVVGEGKLCAMEFVAVALLGEAITANPRGVHPVVARAVQAVNDGASDAERGMLLEVIDRVPALGGDFDDLDHDRSLGVFLQGEALNLRTHEESVPRRGYSTHEHWHGPQALEALDRARRSRNPRPDLILAAQHVAWGWTANGAASGVDYLSRLLRESARLHALYPHRRDAVEWDRLVGSHR